MENKPLHFKATIDDTNAKAAIDRLKNDIMGLSETTQRESRVMDTTFKQLAVSAAAFFSIEKATQFIQSMVQTRGEFQQLEVAFTTMLKSKSEAEKLMAESIELAASTPFGLSEVANASKQLLAYGVDARNVTKTIEMLGNVASGVGSNIGDIAYLYGTLKTQGRAFQQDINQFTNRGIPIIKELAEQFKVSESEVRKLVETGKVGFPQIENAFKNMTSSSGMFHDLMRAQSKTLVGQLANLSDAWETMLNDLGKSQEGIFSGSIEAATELVENYEKVIEVVQMAIVTFGAYKAATMVMAIVSQSQALGSLSAALIRATGLQAAFNLVSKASPLGLVTAAITAAIGAYSLYEKGVFGAKDATLEINKEMTKAVVSANALFSQLKSTKQGTKEYGDTIKIVNDRYKPYLDSLLTNKSTLNDIEKAQKRVTSALLADIAARSTAAKIEEAYGDYAEKNEKTLNKYAEAFAKAYGSDRLPEFFTAMQTAIDATSTSTQNFGKVSHDVYSKYIKPLGGIKYDYFNFKDDIRDVGELKIKTDAVVNKLQAFAKGFGTPVIKVDVETVESTTAATATDKKKVKKTTGEDLELKALEARLSKQEAAYEAYEKFKTEVNAREAKERFATEIGEFETYQSYLQTEMNTIIGAVGDAPMSKWTESQIKQYDAVLLAVSNNYERVKQLDRQRYTEAYQAALTSEEKIIGIKTDYAAKAKILGDKLTADKKAKLVADEKADIDAVKQTAYEKSAIFKKLNEEIFDYSKNELKARITTLKSLLINENIGDTLRKQIENMLKNAESALKKSNISTILGQLFQQSDNLKAEIFNPNITDAQKNKYLADLEAVNNEIAKLQAERFSLLANDLSEISGAFSSLADSISEINPGLADTFQTMGDIAAVGSDAAGSVASFMSGDIIGGISKGIKAIAGVVNIFAKAKESARQAKEEIREYYLELSKGEAEYARLIRERKRDQAEINELTNHELQMRTEMLNAQRNQAKADYEAELRRLQSQNGMVTGMKTEKYGGFLGIGKKTRTVEITESLEGKSYKELEKLYTEGKLTDAAKGLFEELQKSHDEMEAIGLAGIEAADLITERMSGAISADSMMSNIIQGFKDGKRAVSDFADSAEELIQNALLSAMSYQVLQEPLNALVKKFQQDAQDGLDSNEISAFKDSYANIIKAGQEALKQIEDATGMSIGKAGDVAADSPSRNAINRITETQADVITGTLKGMQISSIEGNHLARIQTDAMVKGMQQQQLSMNKSIELLVGIKDNTGRTAQNTEELSRLESLERSLKSIDNKLSNTDNQKKAAGY